jgi:hypothetical protein
MTASFLVVVEKKSFTADVFFCPRNFSDASKPTATPYKDWGRLAWKSRMCFSGEAALLFPHRNLMLHNDGKCEQ